MAFRDTLLSLFPEFAAKSVSDGSLPMPVKGGRSFWWGNGTGPIYGGGLNVGRSIDYGAAAGDVMQNSAVAANVNWISTNWGDAPVKVGKLVGGKFQPETHHPMEKLLDQPHVDYSGKWLMWALIADYYRFGRAYAFIVVVNGLPHEIQYLPAQCMTAIADKTGRLDHYDYKPAQNVLRVEKENVVHFRFGIDPSNTLEGLSPLGPVLPEIVSDNACARYPAHVMHHGGLPPGVFTLKPAAAGSNMAPLDPDMAKALMAAFNEKLQNDPGKVPLIPGPLDFTLLGWKPSEMALNDLREEPETRICAQFGIPPLVVGLRAGLIRSTYSNSEQAVQSAWTNCLIPLQKYFASEWTRQLLPFYGGSEGDVVQYDHSGVSVLQEDQMAKRGAARDDYKAGILTHSEARGEQGRDEIKPGEETGLAGQEEAPVEDASTTAD